MAFCDAFILSQTTGSISDKVECMCAWDNCLVIGSTDGSLSIIQDGESGEWEEVQNKRISKKPINQVETCLHLPGVFVMSDDGVSLYGLPEVNPLANIPNSRYAARIAWNETKGVLAAAIKKRLIFYKLSGAQLVELSSMNLPQPPLSMAWCGDGVCIGFKADYQLVNPENGEIRELTSGSPGRDKRPIVTPLPNREVLVARENVVLFFGGDGRPSRRNTVSWTEAPYAVVLSGPYLVAVTSTMVEVRKLNPIRKDYVVQMLVIDEMKLAAITTGPHGVVYFVPKLKKQIWRMSPVPISEQVAALADMHEFDDALMLSSLLPEGERGKIEDVLRVRNGIHLFSQGQYDDGFSQFAMTTSRSPLFELMLFPSVTPQWLLSKFPLPVPEEYFADCSEPESEEEYLMAINSLLNVLLAHRSRLFARQFDDEEQDRLEVEAMTTILEDEESEAVDTGRRPSLGDIGPSDTKAFSRARRSQLAVLVDTTMLKATLKTEDTGKLLQFLQQLNYVDLEEGQTALKEAGMETLRQISQDPDSLSPPPSGASVAMRGATGVWSAVKYMSKLGKNDASVIQHHAGWILREEPEAALEVFIGAERRLPASLVLPMLEQHAPQYSATYLEAMMENGDAPAETFEQTLVNIYVREALANESKIATPQKLSALKQQSQARRLDRVNTLREMSFRRMSVSGDDIIMSKPSIDTIEEDEKEADWSQEPSESYERLRDLVIYSKHIKASTIHGLIPKGRLLEIRALLLERMKEVEAALEIYVLELKSLALAEQLCDRIYEGRHRGQKGPLSEIFISDKDPSDSDDIYMALLRIYTRSQDGRSDFQNLSDETWIQVAELLSRKRARIDITGIFDMLPDDVEIGVVMPFLEGGLRAQAEQQRNLSIVKNLRTSENFEIQEQLVLCKQRMISVTTDRACWLCHKRIGKAAVVAYPNDSLAHYHCYLNKGRDQTSA